MDYDFKSESIIEVKDLGEFGIDPTVILRVYEFQKGRTLDLNELLKVSPVDEGKGLKFETFDDISIFMSVDRASGPYNKDF